MKARPMSTAAPMTMRTASVSRSPATSTAPRSSCSPLSARRLMAKRRPEEAPVAVDGRGRVAAHLDGPDRSEERDARQVDVRPDAGAENAPAAELALERELERLSRLRPGARDRRLRGGLGRRRRGRLHGGADGVAGRLLGREPALLDPREERHEEEQRNQDAREEDQPGDERLAALRANAREEAVSRCGLRCRVALEREAGARPDRREEEREREEPRRLALDAHRHLVAVLARGGAQALAGAAGRGQDRARAGDPRLGAAGRGGAGAVLRRGGGDRARVRVGERLRGDPDDEEDEREREQPLDEGVAALAGEPAPDA